jgi:tripartite-type tricarboxylate transporter receptor subunit TctC
LIPKGFRIEFLGRRRDFMTLLGARLPGRRGSRAAVTAAPRWLAGMLILLIGGCGDAVAQTWPSKPIRAVVPFAAGSATDIVPRVVLDPLSAQIGQPIVVENRGGAGTTIGSAVVAKAEPDGYTVLATSSAHTLVPTVYPNASYDTASDFAAVVSLGTSPNVLVVSPSKGFKTAHDLVAAAKARPGALNFASAGVGTATHLSAERFRMAAGFDAVHIPFRGGAEAITEVLSGRAEFYFCPLGTALPQVRDGKLLALAVSGPKRASLLPDVPSVLELFPNSDYPFWIGIFMPAKTPREIIQKFHREAMTTMQFPNVKERLETLGMEPMALTPVEFDAHVRAEIATTGVLAKAAGLKPNQ